MALRKENDYWYGDNNDDLKIEMSRYSEEIGYSIDHYKVATCQKCGSDKFFVVLNDDHGVAARICSSCEDEHGIGDSDDHFDDVEDVFEMECMCENQTFHVCCGVALYEGTQDVRWFYLGCRCEKCNLVGVYGDWRNEYIGYKGLLEKV